MECNMTSPIKIIHAVRVDACEREQYDSYLFIGTMEEAIEGARKEPKKVSTGDEVCELIAAGLPVTDAEYELYKTYQEEWYKGWNERSGVNRTVQYTPKPEWKFHILGSPCPEAKRGLIMSDFWEC